jgi:sugar lactone lactonase YvrE
MAIDLRDVQWAMAGNKVIQIQPDGRVSSSAFPESVSGMCIDQSGNIYFTSGNKVELYDTFGTISTIAGYASGYMDGPADSAAFSGPGAIAVDPAGNLYVWDGGNYVIRKIGNDGTVTTFAGKAGYSDQADGPPPTARFNWINQLLWFGNRLLIVTSGAIRQADAAGNVSTVAGNFSQQGWQDNAGRLTLFRNANAITGQGNKLWVADTGNNRIRQITFNAEAELVSTNSLEISIFAGVRVSGAVGRAYRIESSSDAKDWVTETTILLPQQTYLWIDPDRAAGKKFYRAWELP